MKIKSIECLILACSLTIVSGQAFSGGNTTGGVIMMLAAILEFISWFIVRTEE